MKISWLDTLKAAVPLGPPSPQTPPAQAPVDDGRLRAPTTRGELRAWCGTWLDLTLPERPVCPKHDTPLDYLDYVFFERGEADPLVWACRGGGKTLLGAAATLLDMLFKPGVEIRILMKLSATTGRRAAPAVYR